jgi:multidrug efflux pump subunit AcrA (membrane-fusion protein)
MTPTQGSSDSSIPSSRATLIVTAVALLFVVVPALFWQQTWFGRELRDEQISEYLADKEKPRNTQHALAQLSERVQRRDPSVKQWYPSIVSLARHPVAQIRLTSAWVMGQDNGSEDFHQALLLLVDDPDPMVARNAALSLAGFKDPAGRQVLQAMLRSFTVTAPRDGVITNRLTQGDIVEQDTLLARLEAAGETDPVEVRSPLPGVVEERLLQDGAAVSAGQPVMVLGPSSDHAFEALRALVLVGQEEDLELVRPFLRPSEDAPARLAEQAKLTIDEIRNKTRL